MDVRCSVEPWFWGCGCHTGNLGRGPGNSQQREVLHPLPPEDTWQCQEALGWCWELLEDVVEGGQAYSPTPHKGQDSPSRPSV